MKSTWPTARLGDVVRYRKEFVTIDDLSVYQRPRVQLHAQGIARRDEVPGALIKTKKQQVCRTGQFLVAEIDAKLGGFGIVPETLNGAIVSSHYFLFDLNPASIDTNFLSYVVRTRKFRDQVEAQGSTNYAAIRPAQVLGYEIPLPPLTEQRRLVARIEELATSIEEARILRETGSRESSALVSAAVARLFPEGRASVVGDFVRFQTGYAFKSEWFSHAGVRLVRNANVGHGRLSWDHTVRIPEHRAKDFDRFALRSLDVLISLDRPIIATGVKVARVSEKDLPSLLLQRVARAKFLSASVEPAYFFCWLRSPHFVRAIDPGRSNGVPHISHKDIERIPFEPPPLLQQRRIIAEADDLRTRVELLTRLQNEAAAELDALLPAVLERAFNREL